MAVTVTYGTKALLNPVSQPRFDLGDRFVNYSQEFAVNASGYTALKTAVDAFKTELDYLHQDLVVTVGGQTFKSYKLSDGTAIALRPKLSRGQTIGETRVYTFSVQIELPATVLGTATTGRAPFAKGYAESQVRLSLSPSEVAELTVSGLYTSYAAVTNETAYDDAVTGAKALAVLWQTDLLPGQNWELQPEVKVYEDQDKKINFNLVYQQRLVTKGSEGAKYKYRYINIVEEKSRTFGKLPEGGGEGGEGSHQTQEAGAGGIETAPVDTASAAFDYSIEALVDVLRSEVVYNSQALDNLFKDDIKDNLISILEDSFDADAKITVLRPIIDPVQNTIKVSIQLRQANSAGYYSVSYREKLKLRANTEYMKKPDGLSHTYDMFEKGAEAYLTQSIAVEASKAVNLFSSQFEKTPIWQPGTPGWKWIDIDDDDEQEVLPEEDNGIEIWTSFLTRTYIWVSSDEAARLAPDTDAPKASEGRGAQT